MSDNSDFGMGVYDSRDSMVVNMTGSLYDLFHTCNSLLLSLMGQHGALHYVSDSEDTVNVGLEVVIDFNTATVVHDDTSIL